MRITRKTCRSTYSPNHNLKVWIYFLSGQAKSLGGGRWLWIKSTHTMNLDSIQSHLHGIEPPLASYSGLYPFSPSTRGQECIWLVHLGRMNWECWNQFLPFLLGDWPQSTRIPHSSTPPKLGRRGGLPWPNIAITLTLSKNMETSVVQMKLLASNHWHLLAICLKSKWGRMVLLSDHPYSKNTPEAYQNL